MHFLFTGSKDDEKRMQDDLTATFELNLERFLQKKKGNSTFSNYFSWRNFRCYLSAGPNFDDGNDKYLEFYLVIDNPKNIKLNYDLIVMI